MEQTISLDASPNQSFQVSLNIDGQTVNLSVTLRYSEIAGYWVATIYDLDGNVILDSVPFLTGDWPAANILGQYQYLKIGSAFLLNNSGGESDYPGNQDLGAYTLLWSDTAP